MMVRLDLFQNRYAQESGYAINLITKINKTTSEQWLATGSVEK
jgi:hypothetical protein